MAEGERAARAHAHLVEAYLAGPGQRLLDDVVVPDRDAGRGHQQVDPLEPRDPAEQVVDVVAGDPEPDGTPPARSTIAARMNELAS